ncbi:hypothetical protein [Novosphingobium lentum]|uniref:hypothetical protein n=1 Tax=Novosphingobium lentum TaxID=145287 RepID=UPI000834EE14|nr:hypothetical protein [Novosphingobium lentum]
MRRLLPVLSLMLAMFAVPAQAQQVGTRTWVEDGVTWTETTTVTEEVEEPGGERIVGVSEIPEIASIAKFGPFRVLDAGHAALVAETDSYSPADFAEMLQAWPGIRAIEMIDCPGTVDDTANLRLGRMIRAHGIDTDVPPGGSVRSGAVELFLAGAHRHAAADAQFAVHSWLDDAGKQATDFGASDPVNRAYLGYYREMGLAPDRAAAFYALTNSVPNSRALWLHKEDVARYAALD